MVLPRPPGLQAAGGDGVVFRQEGFGPVPPPDGITEVARVGAGPVEGRFFPDGGRREVQTLFGEVERQAFPAVGEIRYGSTGCPDAVSPMPLIARSHFAE